MLMSHIRRVKKWGVKRRRETHQERATLVWLSLDALAVLEHADISLRHPSMDQGALGQLKHPNTAKLRQNI